MDRNDKKVIGWCLYCKNEIYEEDDFVVRAGSKYHVDCYKLIESDSFDRDMTDFTETDYDG